MLLPIIVLIALIVILGGGGFAVGNFLWFILIAAIILWLIGFFAHPFGPGRRWW